MVLDLMGNFSYRFEQVDGNMAIPIWLGGKPHLLGRVGVQYVGTRSLRTW